MTIKVEVAGVDVSSIVDLTSTFSVTLPLTRRGATAQFSLIDSPANGGAGFTNPFVNMLDEVTIYDWDGTTKIFGGVVTATTVRCPSPNVNIWECHCLDGNYYLEAPGTLVNTTYTNQTSDYIVQDLFATYMPTMTTNNVQPGNRTQSPKVFNGLMGWSIFANADGVVRPDVGHRQFHQGG